MIKVFVLLLCIPLGVFLLMLYQKPNVQQENLLNPLPQNKPFLSVTPNPIQETEVHTIDGTMKVLMEKRTTKENAQIYTFLVSDISGKNKRTLFTKTASVSSTMILSPNSWSPDGKYLFIRENNKDSFTIFVFKASGNAFLEGQQYIDVVPLFTKRKTTDRVSDVTGWDAPGLLHVKTVLDSNVKGPSYWFDISSQVFLQLAS